MANVYMGTDLEDFIFGEGTVYESASNEGETEVEKPEVQEEGATEVEEVVEVEEEVEITDEELNAFGVIECVDDPEVACYRIALENEQNYNRIMNAFMQKEFSVLESTGEEMVYEAANVETFFKLVKETIARWWAKIQGVIKKVIDEIAVRTNANANFVRKYKDKDFKTPTVEKKFKGYNFTNHVPNYHKIAGIVGVTVNEKVITNVTKDQADAFLGKFKDEFESAKDKMRGAACGADSVSADEFDKKLKVALFGSEDKVDISLKSFKELLNDINNANWIKKSAKESYKSAESSVKELQKRVKMAESALRKADKKDAGMKVAKCLSDAVNASLGIMSKTMSMDTKAMITKANQDRAMAGFYLMNQPKEEKPKEEPKAESAIDDLNIVLI